MVVQRESSVPEPGYPFSAIVGQDQLRLSLILCAVHPGIGGVLVRGEKGTAKSTVVRALATLLPAVEDEDGARPAKLVELPVGATEDRVVGSIDLEKVLRDGERAFQPGLLAAAHRGVLYVDEVNLLHDHLVDVLLDAAAMGRVHVERDGVSHSHPAQFVLVGTMNPEEGELRPQLLDRFGLAVEVTASRDVDVRMNVVRRRMNYERDPHAFAAAYVDEDAAVAAQIVAARTILDDVVLSDKELRRIAALCASFDVDGMRADLVVARTASAHAHRRRRDPFDEPGIDDKQLDDAMRDAAEQAEQQPDPEPEPDPDGDGGAPKPDAADNSDAPSSTESDAPQEPADSQEKAPTGAGSDRQAGTPGAQFKARLIELPGVGEGAPGRRSRSRSSYGRSVRPTVEPGRGLHLIGTLFAAAEQQVVRGRTSGRLRLAPEDLRGAVKEGREGNLIVFVVDASGSMAARDRLSAVTGAVLSLLRDAYQRRDKVAVITVRGTEAETVLPPTSSVDVAVTRLRKMKTGGKSPLAQGFLTARELVLREKVRDPLRRALVVALTDGRATGGTDPVGRARIAARRIAADKIASVVVDCESGMVRLGLAADFAGCLGGGYVALADLSAEQVTAVVRAAA
ncbi:MAG: VWA domain-containing protein [Rhodococcus sp.]|nr:VWA domain-containing protein [Rhodococcus sp. (in: high G+C Gram-positive bacteria)]MCX6491993.1 VWA domain-containing protein [Rhodococcus sp. (in: high G+C Gram-positive bacteria)]